MLEVSRSPARSIATALALAVTCVGCGAPQSRHDEVSPQVVVASEAPRPPASPSPQPDSEAARCANAVPAGASDVMREQAPSDVGAIPPYAHVSPSGLASCVVRPGTSQQFPRRDDRVAVQYVGWSTSGVMFDSALQRGHPVTFPLNAVIAGWTEGVGMMTPGEIRRLWIPEALAYRGRPGRPAGMLVFDVELIAIEPHTN